MNNSDVVPHPQQRPGKSGPKPRFTLEDLIREAIDQGIDRFSLSRIAKSLGVAAPALYRVVESREHLLFSCLESISRSIPKPPSEITWEVAVEKWSEILWESCETYLGLDRVLMTSPVGFLFLRGQVSKISLALSGSALPNGEITDLLESVADTILVSHLAVTGWREFGDSVDPRSRQLRLDVLKKYGVDNIDDSLSKSDSTYKKVVFRKVKLLIRAVGGD